MCEIKFRAKNPQQKALRKQQILNAARKRIVSLSYEEVNLIHIAEDVGISKAALYRYFKNKESLFLALFIETLAEVITTAEQEFLAEKPATALTNTLLKNPIYCKLSAILHTILERNLSTDEAFKFKQTILTQMQLYVALLSKKANMDDKKAFRILLQTQQALIGVWHMSHPTGAVKDVIESATLSAFKMDFAEALRAHIERIIE